MFFESDNAGPVPDQIIDALKAANKGYEQAYGDDSVMAEVETRLREIFEAPEAAVFLVGTGTAATRQSFLRVAQSSLWSRGSRK